MNTNGHENVRGWRLGAPRAASCKFLCATYIMPISLRGRVFIMLISKRFNLVSLLTLVLRPAGG